MVYKVGNTPDANIRVDLSDEYAAFDTMPKWAQDAIRRAPYAYSAAAIKRQLDTYRMQGVPETVLRNHYGAHLLSPDPKRVVARWGPNHPVLDPTHRSKPI